MSKFSTRFFLCLCIFIITYALAVGLRLYEAPAWSNPALSIQGEKILATHDAYCWLAGAKGISRNPEAALAQITSFLQALTGAKYGNLGFWLPAFLPPLAVLPIVLLGWGWRLEEGAMSAAVLGTCCTGFLLRTRLGFYDTDILTLFFPLLFCVLLVFVFSSRLRSGWRKKFSLAPEMPAAEFRSFLLQVLGIGLVGVLYMWFYPNAKPIILASLAALFLCILMLSKDWWHVGRLSLGLLIVFGMSLAGPIGWTAIGSLLLLLWRKPELLERKKPLLAGLCILAGILFMDSNLFLLIWHQAEKVLRYAKIFPAQTSEGGLSLPTVMQSIREAQTLDWNSMVSRLAGNWLIFWAGILGFAYILYLFPTALVFLPLLGLSLFSFALGNRFTMYGGAVLGIGLGFGLSHIMWRLCLSKIIRTAIQFVICVLLVLPAWQTATHFSPAPILPKPYAQTFLDLKELSPKNARLWQWWDYGYAAQYYAERITFGDGGDHRGDVLYPLARVHMTHSPLQASQIIKYITVSQEQEYAENATEYEDMPEFWKPYLANPVAELEEIGPQKAQSFVDSLKTEKRDWPEDLPPQYFVVSWENLKLAYWISYYGSWDLVTGQANPGRIQQIRGKVQLDMENGTLNLSNGQVQLSGMDVLDKGTPQHFDWSNASQIYALLNRFSQEFYLMDKKIYKSMMVQMLIRDPKRFNQNFELVIDKYPWNRVYRVKTKD